MIFIIHLHNSFHFSSPSRHVSELEETAQGFRKKYPLGRGKKVDNLMTYAQFYSLFEAKLRQRAMLPPRKVLKDDQNREKPKEQIEEINLSPDSFLEVSKAFLQEIDRAIREKL